MNDSVDFDELFIRVLNELRSAYSNLSHALKVRETPVTFKELFEHLLNYEAQLRHSIHLAPLASISMTAMVTLSGSSRLIFRRTTVADTTPTSLYSPRHHLIYPRNLVNLLYQPKSGIVSISGMLFLCLHGTRLHSHSLGIVATSGAVSFVV